MLISLILILVLNILIFFIIGSKQTASGSPYKMADKIGSQLKKTDDGFILDDKYTGMLKNENAWAMMIDDATHTVIWNTDDLPADIPLEYSLADISDMTLGYINDYPTYVGEADNGIVVLGYPSKRYWKSVWPTWDYDYIANLPYTALIALLCNVFLIFIIYITVTGRLIRSVGPIIAGIKVLPSRNRIFVKEKGVLWEVAASINQTAQLLQEQERMLSKKETARANWIAGVSHDIRTPLSMIMGYAGQLRENPYLTDEERQKADIIVNQSVRMRTLINDLNLASKLEYNMQPVHAKKENLVSVVRQVVVEFINMDICDRHPIQWTTDENLRPCPVNADSDLIKRAITNLIQNSISHNEDGCNIYVGISADSGKCIVSVEDNGAGATDQQIEKLNNTPHYMVCDENTDNQRHGLGLLIVKQIASVHSGTVTVEHSTYGGFCTKITLPLL